MWKIVIVSCQLYDGRWPSTGGNNRTIIGPYKTMATINKHALKWGNGQPLRVEVFHGTNIRTHGDADSVHYLNQGKQQ